jgi:transposase
VTSGQRVSLISISTVAIIAICLSVYLYIESQHNRNRYEKTNKQYVNALEQTIQITLREEVNITNQDRSKRDKWLQLFDKHGALLSENGVQSTQIPLDNVYVLDLLPEQAKPIIVEKSYSV